MNLIWKKSLLHAFKILVTSLILYYLFRFNKIDIELILVTEQNSNKLILAILLMLPPYIIVSYRLKLVLKMQEITLPFFTILQINMISYLFGLATPFSSGGDVVKIGYLINYIGSNYKTKSVMATLIDRMFGFLGLFFLVFIASIYVILTGQDGIFTYEILFITTAVIVSCILFARIISSSWLYNFKIINSYLENDKKSKFIKNILKAIFSIKKYPLNSLLAILLSLINHIFWCLSILYICSFLGYNISLLDGLLIFPIAILSNVFGFAGGFGIGTLGFDLVLSGFLLLKSGALIGIIFQTLSLFTKLLGIIFYLLPINFAGPNDRK